MLYYDRTGLSEGADVNRTSKSIQYLTLSASDSYNVFSLVFQYFFILFCNHHSAFVVLPT